MDSFEFYVKEYRNDKWNFYMKNVKPSGVKVKGVPQDIVDAVVHVLGRGGVAWLQKPLTNQFDGKTAKEVLQMRNGEKALKALIMRLPC
ncbi:MAG: hypothetical protein IJK83_02995 [Clostridiales bacterium]|nr:hypothetical protein [Clostridiales bacterium]